MIETWRWFGPNDPITLADVRQTGATGIVTALHEVPVGTPWTYEAVAERKAMIEAAGLSWEVCESIPVADAIKCGADDAQELIDNWITSLRALGRAGIPTVCYNFMPVLDWTRTTLTHPRPDGARALRFELSDFVAYDLFMLKRDAFDSYPEALVTQARARFATMNDKARKTLEETVIAGLPGGAEPLNRASLLRKIDTFDGLSADEVRGNLRRFLKAVVPVAEELGVALAIHPDDPPIPLFGLPRIVSCADDIETILAVSDSPANGITLCCGSYGASATNDVEEMTERFVDRVNFAHLRNVLLDEDGSFEEAPHLAGRVDMVRIISTLRAHERDSGRNIPMRPDHGHLFGRDAALPSNPGYSYIGRLRGLAELRGVSEALNHAETEEHPQ